MQVNPRYAGEVEYGAPRSVAAERDGHVDFKNKYVRTEKFVRERRARKALVGKYRNPYTDDPLIAGSLRTTANTNIVHLFGRLLALKEDALPYELDPHTLRTVGVYNFDGQYTCPTFTAHPKVDAVSGEVITYGYEAGGDGSKDMVYTLFSREGKKLEEFHFLAPYCGLCHDISITPNYIVFQMFPLVCDLEHLKQGGNHWVSLLFTADSKKKSLMVTIGAGHFSNAFEKDGIVYTDLPVINGNVMNWFPDKDGKAPARPDLSSYFARFALNPAASNLKLADPERLCEINGEFSRIDDRFQGLKYDWTFLAAIDETRPYDPVASRGRPFPGFNSIGRMNNRTGATDYYWAGPSALFGEPSFIPRSADAPEGDGFVICLINRFDTELSELVVIDTKNFSNHIALVKLPLRVRPGLHGNFVQREDMLDQEAELVDFEWVPATFDGPVASEISGSHIASRGSISMS
ncbi:hypothetical protein RQP46_011521 [Phenoliferia psychrophenolica]